MSIDLSKFIVSYEVVALPSIIYAHLHRADSLPSKEDFKVPTGLDNTAIEVRIGLYDTEGFLVQMSSQLITGSRTALLAALTIIPNKMIKSLEDENISE